MLKKNQSIVGILLAAGAGKRYIHSGASGNKLFEPITRTNGVREPMVEAVLNDITAVFNQVVIVTRQAYQSEIESLKAYTKKAPGCSHRILIHPQPELGMGTSIALGVANSRDADAWVVCLADMPYIEVLVYQQVYGSLLNGNDLVAPSYHGQRGHPVGFGKKFESALMGLDGDQGARSLLQQKHGTIDLIETECEGVLRDVDTVVDRV